MSRTRPIVRVVFGFVALAGNACWLGPVPADAPETATRWQTQLQGETTRLSLLGDRLVLAVPSDEAPIRQPESIEPGIVAADFIYVGTDPKLELSLEDLPARVPQDASAALSRELAHAWPDATIDEGPSEMAVDQPELRVLRATMSGGSPGETALAAYLVQLPDGHPILILVGLRSSTSGSHGEARAFADAVVRGVERGAALWATPAGVRQAYELFDEATVPAGWARRYEIGGNEEPPYASPFQETLAPERVVGEPPASAVVARSGTCANRPRGLVAPWWGSDAPDVEQVPGTMFSEPITWRRFGRALCWQLLEPENPHGGVSWEIYAHGAQDRAVALAVASSAIR